MMNMYFNIVHNLTIAENITRLFYMPKVNATFLTNIISFGIKFRSSSICTRSIPSLYRTQFRTYTMPVSKKLNVVFVLGPPGSGKKSLWIISYILEQTIG